MKKNIILLSFMFLLSAASFGQINFTMTNLGGGKYEVYATVTRAFPATSQGILGNIGLVFGTLNSTVTTAPTYSFVINPTLNTYYHGTYSQTVTSPSVYNGYTAQSFNELSSATGTQPNAYTANTTIDLGTLTASGGAPAGIVNTDIYLLDFANGGGDGNGNTYIQDGAGTYYTPSNGNSYFVTTTGSTGTTKGGTNNPQYLGPNNSILPVLFTKLTGTANGCMANLAWQTASESNSAYYDVEASLNGTQFTKVAQVASKNSVKGAAYNFAYAMGNGVNFYRLKAVDFDENYTYSGVVTVTGTGACGGGILVTVSPNPASNTINVSGIATGSSLSLFDMGGKKMTQLLSTSTNQTIDISNFGSGIYTLLISGTNGNSKTVKVIKL